MCNIDDKDYAHYIARRTHHVVNVPLRDALQEFSPDFGDILNIITEKLSEHAKNSRVPRVCQMSATDLSAYRAAWVKHVTVEAQSQIELGKLAGEMRDKIVTRLKTLWAEDIGGEYSSYSDYSEETESDETDNDEDEEEEEENEEDEEEEGLRRRSKDENRKDKEKHRKR